jgi:hypothetical protein
MSRMRHKMKRENGGSVKQVWNAGGEQNAAKEAEEKKKGGKVMGEGGKSKSRGDRPNRARGGRLRGEGVGADKMPLTTAARVKHVVAGETPESGDDKVM